jgi:hypothetical protein
MRFAPSLALAALAACGGTLNVKADWNTTIDFTKYKTFDFKQDSVQYTTFTQQQVRTDLANTLIAKGLTRDTAAPQLRVAWRVNLSHETQYNTVTTGGYAYGPAWGGWGGYGGYGSTGVSTTSAKQIPVGALTVALIDTKANQLVFRGEADAQLEQGQSNAELIQQAIQRMFAQFPTKPGIMPSSNDF